MTHNLEIDFDEGSPEDYTYLSPKLIDAESDAIKLVVVDNSNSQIVKVNIEENKIKLVVHKYLINKNENKSMELSIQLQDTKGLQSGLFKFIIQVANNDQNE